MAFNPNSINKHDPTYKLFYFVLEFIFLMYSLIALNFQINKVVYLEMERLSTIAK